MNSFLTKKTMKINGLLDQNTLSPILFAAVLLSVSTSSAFANRPAMEEHAEVQAIDNPADSNEDQAVVPGAPSAVEVMMQQQTTHQSTQQTGTVLQLPAKEMQPGETIKIKLLDLPRRGMSMDKVQNEYGQPLATSDSVGQPPITSWTYNDRVVFFEYSTVLHVVAR